jgi:hypothetical protein
MDPSSLVVGQTYYLVTFADPQQTMPGIEPRVFIGVDVFGPQPDGATPRYYFQDTPSFCMFGLATGENPPVKFEGEEGVEDPEYWVTHHEARYDRRLTLADRGDGERLGRTSGVKSIASIVRAISAPDPRQSLDALRKPAPWASTLGPRCGAFRGSGPFRGRFVTWKRTRSKRSWLSRTEVALKGNATTRCWSFSTTRARACRRLSISARSIFVSNHLAPSNCLARHSP